MPWSLPKTDRNGLEGADVWDTEGPTPYYYKYLVYVENRQRDSSTERPWPTKMLDVTTSCFSD